MTRQRGIAIPASAPVSITARPVIGLVAARASAYFYYFGSFSGRYA